MAVSNTWASLTVCNLALTSARCTGFTKGHGQADFTYIIDLEWTDERNTSIKRTFPEFQKFHNDLVKLFPELSNSKLSLRTSLRENVTSLFTKDKRVLAEKKELLLDGYLFHLLRQPERVRHSNTMLSFFDSRDSDPKPCKSNSPSEKADSGIDLTGDKVPTEVGDEYQHTYHTAGVPQFGTDNGGLTRGGGRDYPNHAKNVDDDNQDEEEEDYDGDTSGTETDDEAYNEDYFLDVGFGELMLQTSIGGTEAATTTPTSPGIDGAGTESSMWCSNLDKFSNILRSSMTNLNAITDNQTSSYRTLKSMSGTEENLGDNSTILDELVEESSEGREETSETESQQTGEDQHQRISEQCESSEEEEPAYSKLTNMRHYYLSSNNLLNTE